MEGGRVGNLTGNSGDEMFLKANMTTRGRDTTIPVEQHHRNGHGLIHPQTSTPEKKPIHCKKMGPSIKGTSSMRGRKGKDFGEARRERKSWAKLGG